MQFPPLNSMHQLLCLFTAPDIPLQYSGNAVQLHAIEGLHLQKKNSCVFICSQS